MNTDKINFTNKTTTDYSEYMNSVFRMIKSPSTVSNIVEIKPESITVGNHLDYSNVPNSYYARTIMNKCIYASIIMFLLIFTISTELNFSLPVRQQLILIILK
jgi:hypothetical protein